MKFFTITVVSLSVGCQVLAAPIDIASTVAGIEPTVESVPSEAPAVVGDLPVVNTLTSPVPDTGLPLIKKAAPIDVASPISGVTTEVESVPSELLGVAESLPLVYTLTPAAPEAGPPVKRAISITTITSAVSGLKSSVSSELTTIMSMSASNATAFAVPVIKTCLTNMATQINTTTINMAPALVGTAVPLTADEAQALLSSLADLESVVFNIKSTLSITVSTVKADALTLIAPEIATVLRLVLPLLSPLAGFVYSIAGLVPGGAAATAQLTSAAGSVMGLASTLSSPVEGILGVGL